eukprot:CAMPEP_0197191094 /NCGR_PEP_ID=MMETSP1423-20130617/22759_1 /TAXON_ID=476441 /ORGANISM="Pseudo-nitzschia heimii, Strain UNC1101" /LENGTH=231 /DNA_ID=CAMNT_0042643633 /DNA_START=344 /DNA_END=1039 /DNA_ORIENTATION=-
MTKIVATNIRTSMDSEIKKSIAKNSFLQYDMKAPNNYFEDVDLNNFFDTNIQTVSVNDALLDNDDRGFAGENSDDNEFETTIIGSTSPTSTVEVVARIQENENDLMVLNDRMLKNFLKNAAVVGSGGAGLFVLRRKDSRNTFEEVAKDDVINVDVRNKYGGKFHIRSEGNDGQFTDHQSDRHLLPLPHKRHIEARKQPKSPKDEAILAARYAAIPTVEERAYQILIDLEMI